MFKSTCPASEQLT